MEWIQHTCRQAAELMSLQRDEPLGFWRSLTLRMHLRVCGDCQQVERQLGQLSDMSATRWRSGVEQNNDDRDQR
jgi:Putative zinc-finger